MLLALWSGFWDWAGITPVEEETRGGISPDDYKRYRKQLIAISKASDKNLYSKVEKIQAIEEEAPAPIKESIKAITKATYDYTQDVSQQINANISNAIARLELLLKQSIQYERERENEEELILMMLSA